MTQMQQFDGTEHITMYHEPERTSIAAILGLVCSCIGCCGGITAIPGIFLSIFGIVGISRSKGRVGGMGFAIAGLLIGILMTALWGGAYGVSAFGLKWMETNAAAPTSQILSDIEAGNFDTARAAMGSPAADVTDEMMIEFREGYLAVLGPVVGQTHGIAELISGYGVVGENIQNYNGRPNHIPFPVEFSSGMGLVVVEMDPTRMGGTGSNQVVPVRIYVVDADGNEYALPPSSSPLRAPGANGGTDPDLSDVDIEDFSEDASDQADDQGKSEGP